MKIVKNEFKIANKMLLDKINTEINDSKAYQQSS